MEALDSRGQKISEGLKVKYTRTHTIGKVEKIISKNGVFWIKIDATNLYYRSDYVEIVEGKEEYERSNKRQKIKKAGFEVEIPVVISDTNDGPGIGGG
jgi:hypothetical protein